MKPSIVVARPIFPEVLDKLSRHFEVRSNQDDAPWTAESWKAALSASQGALTTGADPVKADVLPACPNLRICANMAVGFNNFDVPAMTDAVVDDVARRVLQRLSFASTEPFGSLVRDVVAGVSERLVREELLHPRDVVVEAGEVVDHVAEE